MKNILNAKAKEFRSVNGIDLTNKYFDIMTIQKSLSTLLMDTVAVALQTFVGLILLGFYHPYFLVFDVILVLCLWGVWLLYGKKAVLTALEESKAKYEVANWMQQVSEHNLFFKSLVRRNEAAQISNENIHTYIDKRKRHFTFLFRQSVLLLFIYAIMSAIVLGLGGYLANQGQLTIGQLVAAELVVTVILVSIAKSGKYLESFYDLIAAIDKVFTFYEIEEDEPLESEQKVPTHYDLKFDRVSFATSRYKFKFNFTLEESKKYLVSSYYNSSKLCFIDLLCAIEETEQGLITIGDVSLKHIGSLQIRDLVYIIDQPNIFNGTIEQNLRAGNHRISMQEINEVLELVELDYLEHVYEEGMQTKILPSGYPFWASQLVRLEIARAILAKPKIIVLTEIIEQIEPNRRDKILEYLVNSKLTVIVFGKTKYENVDLIEIEFEKGIVKD